MSKQFKTYLLLGLVLVIWGVVIYRFVDAFDPEDPQEAQPFAIAAFKPLHSSQIDTFSIFPLERDPFLGKTYVKKKSSPKKVTPKKKKPENPWPNVIYRGLVSGSSNIFIIDVNGRQFLFSPKDTNAEVTLVKGRPSEVLLQFGKERKIFSITE